MSGYVSWYGGERRQSWATPPAFFAPLHEEYGFTLDGASESGNGLLPRASTAEEPISWEGERVFCNPPWSNIRPFVEFAATADLAVLLVPARTCARWFHRALELGATVRYFKGKPKFVGAKHVSPVDCVLLVFEKEAARELGEIREGRSHHAGPAPWFPAPERTAFDTLRLPTDRTLAFTWGRWGGFYCKGRPGFWRVCAGWVAVTFIRDEFVAVLRAYLDRVEADALAEREQPTDAGAVSLFPQPSRRHG